MPYHGGTQYSRSTVLVILGGYRQSTNMQVLIVVALTLAVASATYAPAYYAQHIPVIGPNGVPIDTPEVQHARAAHLAAHGKAYAGPLAYGAAFGVVHAPVYGQNYISASHYEVPQVSPQGVPLDTHEVAAAKAQHFAAYAEAASRNGVLVGPVETAEVQLAKAAHFAAHAQAASRAHGVHYRRRRSAYGYAAYPQHIPVLGPNGVPVDTPEVQAERANHFALFSKAAAEAAARPDYGSYNQGGYAANAVAIAPAGHGAPLAYAAPAQPRYQGPIHIPVLNHLGVPVDTPAVQHARAAHFAEYGKAASQAAASPDYTSYAHGGHY